VKTLAFNKARKDNVSEACAIDRLKIKNFVFSLMHMGCSLLIFCRLYHQPKASLLSSKGQLWNLQRNHLLITKQAETTRYVKHVINVFGV
jgi:hypothetical protein